MNGEEVEEVLYKINQVITKGHVYFDGQTKSIVTKEQFNSIKYEVK